MSRARFNDSNGRSRRNAVRLTVERYAVEPTPGHFADTYAAHIAQTVAMLARHGILSLIDFHQDEYGPVFFDNGYPTWMTVTDGPDLYQVGFPAPYLANPALNWAYDHARSGAARQLVVTKQWNFREPTVTLHRDGDTLKVTSTCPPSPVGLNHCQVDLALTRTVLLDAAGWSFSLGPASLRDCVVGPGDLGLTDLDVSHR